MASVVTEPLSSALGNRAGGGLLQRGWPYGGGISHSHLLTLRFLLLNMTAVALLGAAWAEGWLQPLIAGDSTHLVKILVVIFVIGLAGCGLRITQLGRELDGLDRRFALPGSRAAVFLEAVRGREAAGRTALAQSLRLKLATRIQALRHLSGLLVLLGLVGTVIGFIIALAAIDPEAAGKVEAVAPMVSNLLKGMAIALHTTLVGTLLHIWLSLNCRLVEAGSVHFLTKLIERAEADA
jgi:hypothetical protein